jgi:hypothetical protein
MKNKRAIAVSLYHRLAEHRARWREPSLTALLVVQGLVTFVVVPFSVSGYRMPTGFSIALLIVFMSLVIFLARGRWTMFVGVSLVLASAAASVIQNQYRTVDFAVMNLTFLIVTYGVVSYVVLLTVFGPGQATGHRIRGAVVVYLNVGLMFALGHRIIAELIPEAYTHLPPVGSRRVFMAAMNYFSFSTLTSLGYGDIIPVHPLARSLATVEAIAGQLYPPTLLARIVTLEINARNQ